MIPVSNSGCCNDGREDGLPSKLIIEHSNTIENRNIIHKSNINFDDWILTKNIQPSKTGFYRALLHDEHPQYYRVHLVRFVNKEIHDYSLWQTVGFTGFVHKEIHDYSRWQTVDVTGRLVGYEIEIKPPYWQKLTAP